MALAILGAWVALGSALGGVARFFVSRVVGRVFGEAFPWGTLVVNVTGAFAIGGCWAMAEAQVFLNRVEAWQLAVTGFLGSYTTVSSFSLQTLELARQGERRRAAANVVLSLALCLAAVAAGVAMSRALLARA